MFRPFAPEAMVPSAHHPHCPRRHMSKVLILYAHPAAELSRTNRLMLEAAARYPAAIVMHRGGRSHKTMQDALNAQINLEQYERLFNRHTRLVAVTHVSNALGTVNPVTEIVRRAHARGAEAQHCCGAGCRRRWCACCARSCTAAGRCHPRAQQPAR